MNISTALTATKAFTVKNAPTIMTVLGVGGIISAGVIAFKKKNDLDDALYELKYRVVRENNLKVSPYDIKLKPKDAVVPVLKELWAPIVLTIGGSILIFGANGINLKRNAALALGYGILEKTVDGLETEIKERLGEEKVEEIRETVAKKQFAEYDALQENDDNIEVTGKGGYLIYDAMFDKEFTSSREAIDAAVNEINSEILALNDQTVNDFRYKLDLRSAKALDWIGWMYPNQLKVRYTDGHDKKGRPCLIMTYDVDVLHFDEGF